MKNIIALTIICFAFFATAIGQEKYATKTGEITFEASVPSFEEVKAKNANVSAVLDATTGNFAALALMKGFRFKVALMEEHFNENYIESSKYPKASFKGTINAFNISEISANDKEYMVRGVLNFHGVDKEVQVPAMVSVSEDVVSVKMQFMLRPEEFNIKIPSVVSNKIAEDINVNAVFNINKQ